MSFVQHLDELRTRLIRSILALSIAVTVAMVFYKSLIGIATLPHFRAMAWLGLPARFITDDVTKSVGAVMKLASIVGLFFASPYIARELWGFVGAGLYREERRYVRAFAPASFLLFVLGCTFGYFILIPYALYGMITMMPLDKVEPVLNIGDYLGLVLTLTIMLGAIFQLPLVMVFLTKIGVVEPRRWRGWRRHAILANLVLASVLAPPDLLSMVVFVLPLLVLYEIGVCCSVLASR
ncbi:MAG: twin-arginine translocase subunit TatC [Planctomycetes bacterium]|nr:twin-arginine translocase subunit TatC [Planctomycetota bacterium]